MQVATCIYSDCKSILSPGLFLDQGTLKDRSGINSLPDLAARDTVAVHSVPRLQAESVK